jgi:hypothetical protein
VHRMNRESEGRCSGIPHLAENERDVGHPSFVREREADPRAFLLGKRARYRLIPQIVEECFRTIHSATKTT